MDAKPISTLVIGLGGSGVKTAVHIKRQLYDAYNNDLPPNVAIAALDTAKNPVGGTLPAGAIERKKGMGIGQVILSDFEYTHVGGDGYPLAKAVAETPNYPHIESWFLAAKYLRELPRAQFNIDKGAGMFRQFGRLALFLDVATPATSSIVSIIDNKLTKIAKASNNTISVIIIGSLTGGTGAGLMLDMAHLIRRVAVRENINVRLRGFFYLPQAFKGTLNPAELEPAKARAYAGMRELKRFILQEDFKFGYPMHYQPPTSGMDQNLWRSAVDTKLYDFVYLIDGEGQMQLNSRKLEDGVAPAVADAIVSFIDANYGAQYEEDTANLQAKIVVRQGEVGKRAFVSSLGSYSVILPIQQIVERWAYDLGLELLRGLVPGRNFADNKHIIELSYAHNPDRKEIKPLAEVERLLTTQTAITDPHPNSNRQIVPMAMWRQIYTLYNENVKNPEGAIKTLNTYLLRDWIGMLVPQTMDADADVRRVMMETGAILNRAFDKEVETSDKRKPKGNPEEDWTLIRDAADKFVTNQFGNVSSGGGREGGRYNYALNLFGDLQLNRLREYVSAYVMDTLNGLRTAQPNVAKIGKLGWLLEVLQEMNKTFSSVSDLLETVRTDNSSPAGRAQQRRMIEESYSKALEEMRNEAKSKSNFMNIGKPAAIEAQEKYIGAVQRYVDFYRTEFARDIVAVSVRRFYEFIQQTLRELDTWRKVLATHNESLYHTLWDSSRRIETERERADDIANHRMIKDPQWEDQRYKRYLEAERAQSRVFEEWQWETQIIPDDNGVPTLSLAAQFHNTPIRKDMSGQWSTHNIDAILGFTRSIFRDAARQENILQYLMDVEFKDDPEKLGRELAEGSGQMLSLDGTNLNNGIIPTNTILARYDKTAPNQLQFMKRVLRALAGAKGLGDIDGQDTPLQKFIESDDPFRLTILSTIELVALEGIRYWNDCYEKYRSMPWDTRQTTHIFPSEVRAVKYEKELGRLEQGFRVLADRVSLLLEHEERFLEALMLLTHRLIYVDESKKDTQQVKSLWVLQAPNPLKRNNIDKWQLSETAQDTPPLIDAFITYVLRGNDVRAADKSLSYTNPIPYNVVTDYLEHTQKQDAADRMDRDQLALHDAELRQIVEFFMPPIDPDTNEPIWDNYTEEMEQQFLEVATYVVRHDMILELTANLRDRLPEVEDRLKHYRNQTGQNVAANRRHDEQVHDQEMYDLYSISILALEDAAARLRENIEERYNLISQSGTTRRGV